MPAVPCTWHDQGSCHQYSQPGVTLITYLFMRAFGESGRRLQVSSRGQEALMVWACSPLGLWLSKTKQQDTQSAASQLSLTPWPGPRPSLPCHVSGLLPLTLLTILFFLAWARSSEKLFLLRPYGHHVSNACVTQGTANTVPAVPCPWYQRGCCQH